MLTGFAGRMKLLCDRWAHIFRFFLAVVDDAIDHRIVIFQVHFRIAQGVRRQKIIQLPKADAIHIVRLNVPVSFQRDHIADR